MGEQLSVETVMQVIGWASLIIGLIVTIRQSSKTSAQDQIKLENRLTKIETTLDSINQAIVKGDLIAKVKDLDTRLATIEERGCAVGAECAKSRKGLDI